jgi:hypothetical protein
MPPEQDETRARQIEALRQYINQLSEQRDHPKVEVGMRLPDLTSEGRRRPSLPWLLVTVLLVAVALVGGVFVGAVAWSDDRPAAGRAGATPSPTPETVATTTTIAPIASSACKTAVDQANTMLAIAVKLREELAEYSRIMSDPSIRDLPGREVVERSAPTLQAGASDAAKFDDALANYRQVVDQCRLRPP